MEGIYTKATSSVTAQVSDIILREQITRRLIFRPIIIENPSDNSASLKGNFLYQRKSKNDKWEDFETIPLSKLKSGEGYKLEIKSAELLNLINKLQPLYEIYEQRGVPRGNKKFIHVTPQLEQLALLTAGDISKYLNANINIGTSLLAKLFNWATSIQDTTPLENLVALDTTSLSKLNAAVGLQRLKLALALWEDNKLNNDEEFWQEALTEHSFVLEQVFYWPISIVASKAYIGGKIYNNKGGNLVDFLLKNSLTNGAALIEIKTPQTNLLGAEYRGTYNVSRDLSGSIMQTLNYKHSLQENYTSLVSGQPNAFDSFNPQCVVITGNSKRELNDTSKRKAFELYRHQLPGVKVITYDELFAKTGNLINLLEKPIEVTPCNDDLPF